MRTRPLVVSLALSAIILGGVLTAFFLSKDRFGLAPDTAEDSDDARRNAPGSVESSDGSLTTGPKSQADSASPNATDDEAEPRVEENAELGPVAIRGRVLSGEGVGVPNARVSLVDLASWSRVLEGVESRFRNPFEAISTLEAEYSALVASTPSTRTNDDGIYEFRGTKPGAYRIYVVHEDYLSRDDVEIDLPAREQESPPFEAPDVELTPAASIAGRVVGPDGTPVAGATIRAVPSDVARLKGIGKLVQTIVDLSEGQSAFLATSTVSAADGTFRVGSLEPLPHDVEASKEGLSTTTLPEVPPNAKGFVITLGPGASLEGRVLSHDRQPIAGAEVIVRMPSVDFDRVRNPAMLALTDLDFLGESTRTTVTTAEGAFTLAAPRPGAFELVVRAEGHPELAEKIRLAEGVFDAGEIVLPEPMSISGTVSAPNGTAVRDATVVLSEPPQGHGTGETVAETVTDTKGRFEFRGVREGIYQIQAISPTYGEATLSPVEAGSTNVALQMREAVVLRGVVIEGRTRSPIADAEVTLGGDRRRTTRTADDGSFEIAGVNRDAHVFLTVTHPEHGTKWESRQGSDLENGVEIVLEPARAIGGRVIDSSGEPVAGALVELKIPGVPEIFLRMRGSTPLASRSDEDGRFALPVTPGPPSGKITIEATRAGLGIGQVDLEMKDGEEPPEVEIILERPRSITGRVTDLSGQPIAGARVSVRRAVELTGEVAMMALLLPQSEGIVAYSREDGSFTASNLAPGIYDVEAIAARFAKKTLEDVAVEGEETQLEISLDPGGTIRGRVVDHTGEPLAGVEVAATIDHLSERGVGSEGPADRAIREFGQPNAAAVASMTTPASGRFELTHLPDRALCIVARKPGHELAVLSDVRGDESIPDIVLRPFASLTVKVVDAATRLPIPTIELSINGGAARSGQGGWDRYREPFASADGIYTLSELYSGTYTVTVQANGYAQVRRAIALEPGASETMTLELAPGLELAGVVRTSDGQPVPSAHITLYPQENDPGLAPRPHYEAICGTDGSFVVGGLDAARYVVSASHPDYFVESAPDAIVLTESGVEPIEIVVSPAGRLSGTLPIPGSDGQRQVMVELALLPDDRADGDGASERRESEATESPRITSSAWVDARRRFQAVSLRPGRYAATIVIYDHSAAAQSRPSEERLPAGEVDVVVGETKEIDLEPR